MGFFGREGWRGVFWGFLFFGLVFVVVASLFFFLIVASLGSLNLDGVYLIIDNC